MNVPFKSVLTASLLFTTAFCAITFKSSAQIITTFAGNGIPSYSGDGGQATAAAIDYPTRTAMDGSGNLYFCDYTNSRIRKITPSGIISTVGGNGSPGYGGDGSAATLATIQGPAGIAVDAAGNIYFADWLNYRVRKINTLGIITTIAGTGVYGYNGDGIAATTAQLSKPWGIAVDGAGNVYIADRYNARIRKVNTSGIISTIAGNGIAGWSGDGTPATSAKIDDPVDVALDNSGNLYFADFAGNRIRKVSSSGIISTIGGTGVAGYSGDGGAATMATFNNPVGIGPDNAGNVYVGDFGNYVVRKISSSGIVTTIAGTGMPGYSGDHGPATAATLETPYGVAVYGTGDIYICDPFNYRIRLIKAHTNTPEFIKGHLQHLLICDTEAVTSIDSLMGVLDSTSTGRLTWSLLTPPVHGTVVAGYSASTTGSVVLTSGLTYLPTLGYSGRDTFRVRVTDGTYSDTTMIAVNVSYMPNAGIISGKDSVCPGDTVHLSETAAGGFWTSNGYISLATDEGVITGATPGSDTVAYTVINSCGIASAIFPFTVKSFAECRTETEPISENRGDIAIYPNPNSGNFSVTLTSQLDEPITIYVFDIIGNIVEEANSVSNKKTFLDLNKTSGIYFVNVLTDSGKYTKKITVIQ